MTFDPNQDEIQQPTHMGQADDFKTRFETLRQQARALHDMKRYDDERQILGELLAMDPENPEILNKLSVTVSHAGNNEEAIRLIKTAIQLEPEYKWHHYILANYLMEEREFDEAIKYIDEAILDSSKNVDYHLLASWIYHDQDDFVLEEIYLDRVLGIDHSNVQALARKSIMLTREGAMDDAIKFAERARMIDPNDAWAYTAIGFIQINNNEGKAAEKTFREALRIRPRFGPALEGFAEALKARRFIYRTILHPLIMRGDKNTASFVFILLGYALLTACLMGLNLLFPSVEAYTTISLAVLLFLLPVTASPRYISNVFLLIFYYRTFWDYLEIEQQSNFEFISVGMLIHGAVVLGFTLLHFLYVPFSYLWVIGLLLSISVVSNFRKFESKEISNTIHGFSLICLLWALITWSIFLFMHFVIGFPTWLEYISEILVISSACFSTLYTFKVKLSKPKYVPTD